MQRLLKVPKKVYVKDICKLIFIGDALYSSYYDIAQVGALFASCKLAAIALNHSGEFESYFEPITLTKIFNTTKDKIARLVRLTVPQISV